MTDSRDSAFPDDPVDPGSDEALSAYLLGDLDGPGAAAFERRLTREPELARRLDALAGALVSLGGLDEVEEPEGFADRLAARLEAESGVADLTAHRERRRRWAAVVTAAAGVAVLGVAGIQVLGGDPFAAKDQMAQEVALESGADAGTFAESELGDGGTGGELEEARRESAPMLERTSGQMTTDAYSDVDEAGQPAGGGVPGSAADSPSGQTDAPHSASAPEPSSGPVIADEGAALSSDEDLRGRYMGLPEGERLRGTPRDEAAEIAARHAEQVRAAGPFPSSGVRPGQCLDEVRAAEDARTVTRVERITWRDGEALAYVLAMPSPGAERVDRFEVWVMGTEGCDVRRMLSWS